MELIQDTPGTAAYLAADGVIDHEHPRVRAIAAALSRDAPGAYAYAKAAFEFVRDAILHSGDAGDPRVTWRASDVLARRTGICYAKARALVALLGAAGSTGQRARHRRALPSRPRTARLPRPARVQRTGPPGAVC